MQAFLGIIGIIDAGVKAISWIQGLFASHGDIAKADSGPIKKEVVMKLVSDELAKLIPQDTAKITAATPHISNIVDELVEVMKIVEN